MDRELARAMRAYKSNPSAANAMRWCALESRRLWYQPYGITVADLKPLLTNVHWRLLRGLKNEGISESSTIEEILALSIVDITSSYDIGYETLRRLLSAFKALEVELPKDWRKFLLRFYRNMFLNIYDEFREDEDGHYVPSVVASGLNYTTLQDAYDAEDGDY